MKKLILIVLIFLLFVNTVQADTPVTFTWDPNIETDLKEYRLYQSETSGNYAPGIDIPVAVIPTGTETVAINVQDGAWFWVLTAADCAGNESGVSNEVTKSLDTTAPLLPNGLNIAITIKVVVE